MNPVPTEIVEISRAAESGFHMVVELNGRMDGMPNKNSYETTFYTFDYLENLKRMAVIPPLVGGRTS